MEPEAQRSPDLASDVCRVHPQIPAGLVRGSLQWHCQRSSVALTATEASTASAGSQAAAHRAMTWTRTDGTGAFWAAQPRSSSPSIESIRMGSEVFMDRVFMDRAIDGRRAPASWVQ